MYNCYDSHICCQSSMEQLQERGYHKWMNQGPTWHRKQWEDMFILAALDVRGFLAPGMRGLGFAVGSEVLPAVFASRGVEVLATDLGFDQARAANWVQTNQHCGSADQLRRPDIVNNDVFDRLVSFRTVDMNALPDDLTQGEYDFVWSTCSFEHLGSIEAGLNFVINAMSCLRPGGVAVHTTEFNLSSNTDTQIDPSTVIYRERDMTELAKRLDSHKMRNDFTREDREMDRRIDFLPHTQNPHIRLQVGRYVTTSYGLVVLANR